MHVPTAQGEEKEAGEEEEEDHLLNDISSDPPIIDAEDTPVPAWSVRTQGQGPYAVSYAISHAWPGAVAFCYAKDSAVKFANLYIGDGLPNTGAAAAG